MGSPHGVEGEGYLRLWVEVLWVRQGQGLPRPFRGRGRGVFSTGCRGSGKVELSEWWLDQPLTMTQPMEVHDMTGQNLELTRTGPTTSVVVVDDSPLTEASIDLLRNGLTEATWKAYKADRNALLEWGHRNGVEVLPATPNTVTNYVSSMEGVLATSTICRRVAFWSWWHDSNDLDPNPCRSRVVRQALKGLRHRSDRPRQARPLSSTDLARMVVATPEDLRGLRDRAVLVVGLALGRRRSELVALDVEDLSWLDHGRTGYSVTIRRSKTDQEGKGDTVFLPETRSALCPVHHLRAWLQAGEITEGPLFRSVDRFGVVGGRLSDRSVSTIVRGASIRAGLPEGQWSGHSLRAGFVTDLARRGASTRSIARQTGHSPTSPVLHRYVRLADPREDNAVTVDGWL